MKRETLFLLNRCLQRKASNRAQEAAQLAGVCINAFPANSFDLTGEWGRADFDQRHRFNLLGTLKAGKHCNLGTVLRLNSGAPYTITTGRDDNRDSQALDRPAGVGRNTLEGPSSAQLDVRLSRDFYFVKKKQDKGPTMTAALDAFNVFNRVNYAGFERVNPQRISGMRIKD